MGEGPIWLITYGQSSSCSWLSPLCQEGQIYANKQYVCPTITSISNSFLKNLHSAGSCSEAAGYLHLNQAQASLALPNNAGLPNPHHCSLVWVLFRIFYLFVTLESQNIRLPRYWRGQVCAGQLRGGMLLSETPLPRPGAALLPLKRSQDIALSSCLLCISQPTGMTLTSVIFLNFTLETDLEVNFNLDDF